MRAIGVDWSGASPAGVQRRAIWIAEAADGRLRSLSAGRDRREAEAHLLRQAQEGVFPVVGVDFCFGFPSWWVAAQGAADGPMMWEVACREGEAWLDRCSPPFWGRAGRPRPRTDHAQLRRTECAVPAGTRRPKSIFQIGGAGSVGTASIRGMPALARLRQAGMVVWPFDAWSTAAPVVVEAYPRWCTGNLVKSRPAARAAHLRAAWPDMDTTLSALAIASEDAFDAACTALVLSQSDPPRVVLDDIDRLEGRIFPTVWPPSHPGSSRP